MSKNTTFAQIVQEAVARVVQMNARTDSLIDAAKQIASTGLTLEFHLKKIEKDARQMAWDQLEWDDQQILIKRAMDNYRF